MPEISKSLCSSIRTAQGAWGFPAFGGRLTTSPCVEVGLGADAHDYTLGWRLERSRQGEGGVAVGLKAVRRDGVLAEPEHAVAAEVFAYW